MYSRHRRNFHRAVAVAALVSAGAVTVLSINHPAAPGSLVVTDRGWNSSALSGSILLTCHFQTITNSVDVLPDPACTPGAVDRAVTNQTISTTICRPGGYTPTVRAPQSLTGPFKLVVMKAYGLDPAKASDYELDHLVPLEDGGSNDVRNLWPEPNADAGFYPHGGFVHNDKDQVETLTHRDICAGTSRLDVVQRQMASNWTLFVQ